MDEILRKIKIRLGVVYDDPIKDEELTDRITACIEDMALADVPEAAKTTQLYLDTVERYLQGGQNDLIYIANVIKLRGVADASPT